MQPGAAPPTDVNAPQDDAQKARNWWRLREREVERELATSLQRRMEAQRRRLYAFKMEQSKWEHELQLRISKYAHDRKLLSEHNVELQDRILTMEAKFAHHQRDMDQQVQHVMELEGRLHEKQVDVQHMQALRQENDVLHRRLRHWERCYREEKVMAAKDHEIQQEELLTELEKLLVVSKDERVPRGGCVRERDTTREQVGQPNTNNDPLLTRVKELEATCKQKDQTVYALKTIVEQQETVFDEKVKILTAKYDQVKTINMALQKRLMDALTKGSSES